MAEFVKQDLSGARFEQVDFSHAWFRNVYFTGATLRGAWLEDVDIDGEIRNVRINGVDIGPLVERYFRGGAPTTREHLRLMAIAADMVMSPFGKRSQLYERLQSGEVDRMRQRLYGQYQDPAPAERMREFISRMDRER